MKHIAQTQKDSGNWKPIASQEFNLGAMVDKGEVVRILELTDKIGHHVKLNVVFFITSQPKKAQEWKQNAEALRNAKPLSVEEKDATIAFLRSENARLRAHVNEEEELRDDRNPLADGI